MDASSVSSIVAAFDAAEKATGTAPDVLVNNAGIAMPSPVVRMDEHSWDSLMDVNLKGAFFVAKEACVRMIKHDKGGSIVNIASILGLSPGVSQANYGASKAALLHLTKTLAVEVSRNGIRCNALSPGYFETEMNGEFFHSNAGKAYLAKIPPRRLGLLTELDGPFLLLASDATSFMAGTNVVVDARQRLALIELKTSS